MTVPPLPVVAGALLLVGGAAWLHPAAGVALVGYVLVLFGGLRRGPAPPSPGADGARRPGRPRHRGR